MRKRGIMIFGGAVKARANRRGDPPRYGISFSAICVREIYSAATGAGRVVARVATVVGRC